MPWGGGDITLGAGDAIGFMLAASGGEVPSTVSESLTVAFPYGVDVAGLCDNEPNPAPRRRSATVVTNHVRFYMSYQLIPAGSNTLPPQVSEIIPIG